MNTSSSKVRTRASKPGRPSHVRYARANGPAKLKKRPQKSTPSESEEISLIKQLLFLGLKGTGRFMKLLLLAISFIAALIVILAFLLAAYLYLSESDYFTIKHIKISGAEKINHNDIKMAIGLNSNVNIWKFDVNEATVKVSALPWLAEAKLSKKWPDTIYISLKEHKPRVLVNLSGFYYLNENGVPFKAVESGENPDLPIVTGFSEDDLMSPKLRPMIKNAIEEVFTLLDILSERNDELKLENISEINYDIVRGLTLFTKSGGLEVKIGFGAYEEKFRRVGRVLAHLKMAGKYEGLAYINLEASPRVTVSY